MSIFRLAHLSDPHLPPPPGAFGWRDLASKRLLSRIAWRRKHKIHRLEVLEALVADLKAHAPDHVAITGDLTNFASPVEIAAATRWLQGLGPAETITVSPGNHDALVGETAQARFAPWTAWLGDDEAAAFPQVRLRGPVALFNLCSAVPTALHLATGRLGVDQLDKLDALLADPAFADRFKVLLLHHPPIAGAVSGRKSLDDQGPLRDLLARRGVDLVLHGHAHESLTATIPGPGGRSIPVLGVPSASAWIGGHSPARWHALEIEPRENGGFSLRVIARGLDPQTGGIRELGRYSLI
ncbi:metallophosphoesterase [Caulobacter radicis]|uniref:metallophosphoesterase family protein n=1 Tax=Caulobacter radicis TaxID=2172650 RepID=UPI000D57A2A0|nr:metallophosphoesterase [Caulobacter radicis]PVM93391.1 metallophosphoesterase [Caulobacter radicis]